MKAKLITETSQHSPDVVRLTLIDGDFGSLQAASLETLNTELQSFARTTAARVVILDVRSVRYAGAKFLGIVVEFYSRLRAAGVEFELYGDVGGVFEAAGLHSLLSPAASVCPNANNSSVHVAHTQVQHQGATRSAVGQRTKRRQW